MTTIRPAAPVVRRPVVARAAAPVVKAAAPVAPKQPIKTEGVVRSGTQLTGVFVGGALGVAAALIPSLGLGFAGMGALANAVGIAGLVGGVALGYFGGGKIGEWLEQRFKK